MGKHYVNKISLPFRLVALSLLALSMALLIFIGPIEAILCATAAAVCGVIMMARNTRP
jgi:hypothetical protein